MPSNVSNMGPLCINQAPFIFIVLSTIEIIYKQLCSIKQENIKYMIQT